MYIKSNTNVVDLDKIISRMEQQDHAYEGALKRINSLEEELKRLNSDMNDAVSTQHQIYSMDVDS